MHNEPTKSNRLATTTPDIIQPPAPFIIQRHQLSIKLMDHLNRLLKRRGIPLGLFTPASNAFHFCISASLLGVHFLADLASSTGQDTLVYQLPAACFTGAVLGLAVQAELSPFPVAAAENVLVVVAHGPV